MKMVFGGMFQSKPKIETVSVKSNVMGVPDTERITTAVVGETIENWALKNSVEIKFKCKKVGCFIDLSSPFDFSPMY